MSTPILATKLYVPPPRPGVVLRPRLIERLNEGLHRKLALVCAPAGFGKTTLLGEWVAGCGRPAAWLSLDEGDSDPTRFLAYLVAALRTVAAQGGPVQLIVVIPEFLWELSLGIWLIVKGFNPAAVASLSTSPDDGVLTSADRPAIGVPSNGRVASKV